jgi:hypothetical protein
VSGHGATSSLRELSNRRSILGFITAALLVALSAPVSAHVSARRCGDLTPHASNSAVDIRSEKLSCKKARAIALEYLSRGTEAVGSDKGYRCRSVPSSDDATARVSCVKGSRRVRFTVVVF